MFAATGNTKHVFGYGKKRRNKAELMNWYSRHIYYIGNNSSKNRLYGNDMHEGPTPA